jgi:hypothetical protein
MEETEMGTIITYPILAATHRMQEATMEPDLVMNGSITASCLVALLWGMKGNLEVNHIPLSSLCGADNPDEKRHA